MRVTFIDVPINIEAKVYFGAEEKGVKGLP
jgi:hypothetical protein